MKRELKLSLAMIAIAWSFAQANTAASAPCSGYNAHFPISAETIEVSKGHKLITVRNHDTVITDDPKSVWNMNIGECAGTVVMLPDGRSSSMGHCARKDKDGDSVSLEWVMPLGAEKGTWKMTGGTGKFAGRTDNGWWTPGQPTENGSAVNRWGGECK
jgi:hypothetical protein